MSTWPFYTHFGKNTAEPPLSFQCSERMFNYSLAFFIEVFLLFIFSRFLSQYLVKYVAFNQPASIRSRALWMYGAWSAGWCFELLKDHDCISVVRFLIPFPVCWEKLYLGAGVSISMLIVLKRFRIIFRVWNPTCCRNARNCHNGFYS
jgi:hypothetical protein